MLRTIRFLALVACQYAVLGAASFVNPSWDLERIYHASPYAFSGQLTSIEIVAEVKTGVMGVELSELSTDDPDLREIVWRNVRLYTFAVQDAFKGDVFGEIEVYAPTAETLWSYFKTELGYTILSKAADPDPYAGKLSVGEQGLFFVNAFNGSTLPVLVALRSEEQAERGIRILQTFKQTQGVDLAAVIELDDTMQAAAAEQERVYLESLEKRYFKITMLSNLQERRSELEKIIAELGYDSLWSQDAFEAKHAGSFAMFVEEGRVRDAPSRPESGKERLWYECTMEIEKIDMILKARTQK